MLSIITPVLNGEKYIEKTISSVKEINIPHEHIIVDGGSTDRTLDIIGNVHDVKLLMQRSKTGMYGAIHEGISASVGAYVSYINADDYYIGGIENLFKDICRQQADLIYGDAHYYYTNENRTVPLYGVAYGAKYFLKQGIMPFSQSSTIFSREVYDRCRGFDFRRFRVCGDLDLFQKIAYLKDSEIIYRKGFCSVFLKTGQSLGDQSQELYEEEFKKLTLYNGKSLLVRGSLKLLRLYSQFLL
jgi:glycosyltransferase involved in cell wall biosynthesis